MLSGKSGLLWVIALSLVTALLFSPCQIISSPSIATLIAQGEGWRIITGNLAHTNGWHLLLNLSGLAVLYSLFQEYLTGWRLPVLLLLLGTAVGPGIWMGLPANPVVHGTLRPAARLVRMGAMQDIRFRRHSGWLMLAGVAIKLGGLLQCRREALSPP